MRTTTSLPRISVALTIALSLGLHTPILPFYSSVSAADLTWTGANSGNISDTGNWNPAQSISGNTAIFQGNITNANITQDLAAGTTLTGISFLNDGNVTDGNVSEFTISGNSITLDGDITMSDIQPANTTLTDVINVDIALASDTVIQSSVETFGGSNSTRALRLNGVISGTGRTLRKNNAGTLILAGNNTFDGGFIGGNSDTTDNWIQVGVDSIGSVGNITSSAFGTGAITIFGAKISSDGTTARTIYNDILHSGGNGQSIALGDSTNNGELILEGAFASNGTTTRTVRVDSNVTINGAVSTGGGAGGTLSVTGSSHPGGFTVGNRLTLTGNNTDLVNLDITSNGRVQLNQANAGGTNRIDLVNSNAHLEIGNGVVLQNEVLISNTGGDKFLRLTGLDNNTGEFAGNITVNENADNNFYIWASESHTGGTNNSNNQVLTISGVLDASALAANEAIRLQGQGTVIFTNSANTWNAELEFSEFTNVNTSGTTLLVTNANAIGSGNIRLNTSNSMVKITPGQTITNDIVLTNTNGVKRLRLTNADGTQGSGISGEISGNITIQETTVSNAEIQVFSGGGNNDPNQILTLSGDISGNGFEHNTDGIIRLTGNNTGITAGTIDIGQNGSTLRLGGNNSAPSANINLGNSNTYLQLENGVTAGATGRLVMENNGENKWLEVFDSNASLAETATYSGNIETFETAGFDARFRAGSLDTLIVSGVVASNTTQTRLGIGLDGLGTIILTGNNTTSAGWGFGLTEDNEFNEFTGTGRQDSAFVIVNNNNALGTGGITARGAQLRASVAGLTLSNLIYLGDGNEGDGYNFNVGGNNSITFDGNIVLEGSRNNDIGLYASSAQTFTFSGDVNMNSGSIEIHGTEGHTNASAVFSGNFTNLTDNDNFELNEDFDNSMVTISGNNSGYNGQWLALGSNSTLFFDGGREVFGNTTAINNPDRLRAGNGGIIRTNTDVALEAFYGFRIEENGSSFNVDGGTTFTLNGNVTNDGAANGTEKLTKLGNGTLVLNGVNTGTASIQIDAGTLAANNSAAIPDDNVVGFADVAGATLRLDADETIGGLSGGGSTGGTVDLQANNLTINTGAVATFGGNITGTGNLTKTGASSQILSGTTNFTGDTAINAGTLSFSAGSTHQTNVTVNDGATIGGEGSIGDLTLAANSIINFDGGTTGALSVGNLTSGATVFVDPIVAGSGNIIVFSGTYTPTVSAAVDFQLIGGGTGRATFGNTTNAITFISGAATRTWNGNINSNWDNGTSANWQEVDNLFFTGDTVFFDDSAVSTGNVTLTSGNNIIADSITFGNATNGVTASSYTILDSTPANTSTGFETISASGGGITVASNTSSNISIQVGITGSTDIVHNGSGTLSIGQGDLSGNATAITHSRTGSTVVWGDGTLQDQTSGTSAATKVSTILGDTATGTLIVGNGGTFDINGDKNFQAYGTGSIILGANNTLATLSNSSNLGNNENDANAAFNDEIVFAGNNITIDTEGGIYITGSIRSTVANVTLNKENDDTLRLLADNTSANLTQINVNDGTIIAQTSNLAFGTAHLTTSGDGRILLSGTNRTIANNITLGGGANNQGGIGSSTNNGTATFTGDIDFTVNGKRIDPGNGNRNVVIAGNLTASNAVGGNIRIIDIFEGTTRFAAGSNVGSNIRFHMNDSADTSRIELSDGYTLNNEIRVENSGSSKQLRLQSGASTGTFGGTIDLRETDDGVTDIRALSGQTLTFSGNVIGTGTGRLDIIGDGNTSTADGTLIFAGTNTFAAETQIQDRVTMQIGSGGTSGTWSGNISANAPTATVAFNRSDSYSYGGVVSGNASVSQIGGGSTTFTGAHTYTGTTSINNGTLVADVADVPATSGALGNGGNVTFGGGTLQYTANSAGTDYSNRIKNSTSAVSLDTNGQDVTLAGVIDATNTGGLTKLGAGSLALDGANTYTGNTTVSAGTFLVNGSTDAGSAVTVGTGGTLGGSGTVGGTTTIQSGGTHTGGTITTAAQQTFSGDLNYNDGATVSWNLIDNSTGAANFDNFVVGSGTIGFENGGTFNIGLTFTDSVNFYDSFWQDTTNEWKIWDFAGGSLDEADFDSLTINLFIDGSSSAAGLPGDASAFELRRTSDLAGTDGIWLHQISAIPEPGTYGLMALALAGFGWFARRRRITAKKDN